MIKLLNQTKLTLLFASICLLAANVAQAKPTTYTADILSNGSITLTINSTKKEYDTGNTLDLKEGDKVCFVKGEGSITIEGGKRTFSLSDENPECQTLPMTEKAVACPSSIALKDSEPSVAGLTRGTELSINKLRINVEKGLYTSPIYPDNNGNLRIESNSWITSASRLPIILQLLDSKNNEVERFASYCNKLTSFALPKRLLADKNGYTIKVSNQRGNVIVKSIFYLEKTK